MRVALVTGSREWLVESTIYDALNRFEPDLVVHGHCPTGADHIADEWCRKTTTAVLRWPAQWDKGTNVGWNNPRDRSAGPRRNKYMVNMVSDLMHCEWEAKVLAFPMPESRGTLHCISVATKAGLPIERFDFRFSKFPDVERYNERHGWGAQLDTPWEDDNA